MRITEINTERGLAPSGIEIADYVVNPYRGCEFGCLYCYVRKNKIAQRAKENWGEFVDVKVNIPELIQKDIRSKKPSRILVGSITDPYQPLELKYQLTRRSLLAAVEHQIPVTLLTRSSHILRDLDILKKIPGMSVYFTINWPEVRKLRIFEPRSFTFTERLKTIEILSQNGIGAVPNVSPLFPGLFNLQTYFKSLAPLVDALSFESLNLKVMTGNEIDKLSAKHFPAERRLFQRVYSCRRSFDEYWNSVKRQIIAMNESYGLNIEFRFHSFDSYFGRD